MTATQMLFLFVILTPIVVSLIKLGLKRAQVAVLKNLSALILTGAVTLLFAVIAASYEIGRLISFTSWRDVTLILIDFCLIFTPAHWLYQFVKNWREKRRGVIS